MIRQCHLCGNCGESYRLTPLGFECPDCLHERGLFDADELGLDPETDNTPKAHSREA
ncbi:hypothetical protein LCGC14_2155600 [marine sediment metagenome]|uniref:Uncharacterized protein n=1 Tax=marine sediment metagenome TaxID=412755 RepID=A0A0F9DU52_9ZZZZ